MYVFDLNRHYNWPIVALIQIKHVHSSVSFQQATYQKYNQRGCESDLGRLLIEI